jgi:hypothetical protein
MSTQSIDVGIALIEKADRVMEDRYLVAGEAVDLEEDACSCGHEGCWHLIAATVHQARADKG